MAERAAPGKLAYAVRRQGRRRHETAGSEEGGTT